MKPYIIYKVDRAHASSGKLLYDSVSVIYNLFIIFHMNITSLSSESDKYGRSIILISHAASGSVYFLKLQSEAVDIVMGFFT